MSTSTDHTLEPTAERAATQRDGSRPGGRVPAPPRPRRRWGLFAAMVALVAVGAVGNVWLHAATTDARMVVAARVTIERGSVIDRAELSTVAVGAGSGLSVVPASDLESLVGQRAAVDVAAGSLMTPQSVTSQNVPGAGFSLVGVAATPAMMPGTTLVAGDRVRVVSTPGQDTVTAAADAAPVSVSAVVVSVQAADPAGGQAAQSIITVQVPSADAPGLAAMAATGNVAVVLDSRDR